MTAMSVRRCLVFDDGAPDGASVLVASEVGFFVLEEARLGERLVTEEEKCAAREVVVGYKGKGGDGLLASLNYPPDFLLGDGQLLARHCCVEG